MHGLIQCVESLGDARLDRGEPVGEGLRLTGPGVIPCEVDCGRGEVVENRPAPREGRRNTGHAGTAEWIQGQRRPVLVWYLMKGSIASGGTLV